MKLSALIGLIVCGLFSGYPLPQANANQMPATFMWDNFKGFLPVGDCVPGSAKSVDLLATLPTSGNEYFESLLGGDGKESAKLALGTLVRYMEGPGLNLPRAADYAYVRVVGTATKGYLPRRSIQELKYFSILLNGGTSLNTIGTTSVPVKGSQWLAEQTGEGYSTYTCREGGDTVTYIVFDVYRAQDVNRNQAVARVLVNRDRTDIFNEIQVFQIRQVVLGASPSPTPTPTPEREPAPPAAVVTVDPVVPQTPALIAPIPRDRPLFFKTVVTSRFSGDQVICIGDASMNAHGDPAKDATFNKTFPAIRYELVKPVKDAEKHIQVKKIGGQVYEFAQFEFPDHNKSGEKTGWVALGFVSERSSCNGYSSKAWAAAKAEVLAKLADQEAPGHATNNSQPRRHIKGDPVGNCASFVMDADGTMGSYGDDIYNAMKKKGNIEYYTKKDSLKCRCPKFNSMSDEDKLLAWTYFWTVVASYEAGTTKGRKDGKFCSPSVKHASIHPGIGLWAMETEAFRREYRRDCQGDITKGEVQARCTAAIMVDTQLSEGNGVCSNSGYWSTINGWKGTARMKYYKPCW